VKTLDCWEPSNPLVHGQKDVELMMMMMMMMMMMKMATAALHVKQ